MKRSRFSVYILTLLITAVTASFGCTDPKASFRKKLDAALPQKGEVFDFTETAVELTMITDSGADRQFMLYEIKRLSAEAAAIIADEGDYEIIIEKLNSYFFGTRGFTFDDTYNEPDRAASPDSHSLEKLIRTKKGICMNMSILYLIISDRLELPMKGVLIPGHIYVRCEPSGRSGINIETTMAGIQYYGYGDIAGTYRLGKNSSYSTTLDKYGVLGAYLSNISIFFLNNGRIAEAEACAEKSSEMLPGAAEPLISLAVIKSFLKDHESAELYLLEALKINPDAGFVHFMLGKIYIVMKRKVKAVESLERSLRLSPEMEPHIKEELKKAELI